MAMFQRANILLPKMRELSDWAVIACDQFTSDAQYWARVRHRAHDKLSTIHMILPEAELGAEGEAEKIASIDRTMLQYLNASVFQVYENSYIYVERTLQNGSIRPGLVGAVDLECYDYRPGSVSPIRATEKTVLERIPPRRRVRHNAPLEFPHVLMLCDDDRKCLIEPITQCKEQLPLLYDFDLMEDGGHITGRLVQGAVAEAFDERFRAYAAAAPAKYADLSGAPVVLAVGDGNHSLATAKSCYEAMKCAEAQADMREHPARYALVELENIHDPSQQFEPIHRVVFDVDVQKLLRALAELQGADGFRVEYVCAQGRGALTLDRKYGEMAVAVLQEFLDPWMAQNGGRIDYIHGADEVELLAGRPNCVGFLLPPMEKQQLFRGVISGGVLPRKTFSMGHAREKRYYLEGRKIK